MSKIQDIKVILSLMERLGVSLNELILHDKPIEITKKFPLPVYFSDGTHSTKVDHYYGQQRLATGVIIGNTIYALRTEHSISHDRALNVCCSWNDEFFRKNSCLPTKEQLDTLMEHITDYNKIRLFFGYYALWFPGTSPVEIAIADERNNDFIQYRYDMKSRGIHGSNGSVAVLPVVNL